MRLCKLNLASPEPSPRTGLTPSQPTKDQREPNLKEKKDLRERKDLKERKDLRERKETREMRDQLVAVETPIKITGTRLAITKKRKKPLNTKSSREAFHKQQLLLRSQPLRRKDSTALRILKKQPLLNKKALLKLQFSLLKTSKMPFKIS